MLHHIYSKNGLVSKGNCGAASMGSGMFGIVNRVTCTIS